MLRYIQKTFQAKERSHFVLFFEELLKESIKEYLNLSMKQSPKTV